MNLIVTVSGIKMKKRVQTELNISPPNMEGVDISQILKQSKDDTHVLRIRKKKIKTNLPKDPVLYLPTRFEKMEIQYPLSVFEQKYCQCKLVHSSIISKPVLASTIANGKDKQANLDKLCIQSFKIITSCESNLNNCTQLKDLINSSPSILVDEVFTQLLMQSTSNEKNIWRLFLIICTLFVPSENIAPYLKGYFAMASNSNQKEIQKLAILCYIRLSHVTSVTKEILKIPDEALTKNYKFGVSISEQMYNQREKYPNLPIPYTLYRIITLLQNKSCQSQEGIFRLNGNMKLIDTLADDLNNDNDTLENPEKNPNLNDLSSLLKKWIRELPEPIVPFNKIKALEIDSKDDSMVEFCELLPRANHASLMYLVGFLQSLLNYSDFTKMNEHNFAICFAPAIVKAPENTEPARIHFISELGINFIETLILQWNTIPLFPLKEQFLQ
ncbi:Rho GTPase activating protein 39 [Tritrichomonas musculus]|uniref:Rho GTPase activating protein 39 n=1 Tax=Tritrichomonas musculus TaxID=1915356 RepID=A0ABR2JWR6_9EUKA